MINALYLAISTQAGVVVGGNVRLSADRYLSLSDKIIIAVVRASRWSCLRDWTCRVREAAKQQPWRR